MINLPTMPDLTLQVQQTDTLLATKFFVPRPRPNRVARTQLVEQLNEAVCGLLKLVLISAPAGYGKTTLLAEWVEQSRRPIAWLSLDEADNTPRSFWNYLVTALQTLQPGFGERTLALLQAESQQNHATGELLVSTLINEFNTFREGTVLVLDDYHTIHSHEIHQALAYLLDHLPPEMRVVISTRTDPPLPLAQLRARNELVELRAGDLRFTSDEADAFLNRVMRLHLAENGVTVLNARTEGWIAGLQLAALSMRGHDNLPGFIQDFAGTHRFILDYLADQVLQRQPPHLLDFMLQTSILERMNAALCAALTGQENSQAILDLLDQNNSFLVSLDDDRGWYRYHHLFADVLRHRLQQSYPHLLPQLHQRASTWYEAQGLLPISIHHALAAGSFDHAAELMEQSAETLLQRGETATLAAWLRTLPQEVSRRHPALCLAYARGLADRMEIPAMQVLVSDAERKLATQAPGAPASAALHGRAAALRAFMATLHQDFDPAVGFAHHALELLPEGDTSWRSFVALNLAGAYRFSSRWTDASAGYLEASTLSQAAGNPAGALMALSLRGEVLQAQGSLRQAASQYDGVLRLAADWGAAHTPVTSLALAGLGRIWTEWNDLDAAGRCLQEAQERGKQGGIQDAVLRSCLARVRLHQSQGDLEGAAAALQDAEMSVRHMGIPEVEEWIGALRAQLWLSQGDIKAASRWAARANVPNQDAVYPAVSIALARVYLAQNRPAQALALLDHALKSAEDVGRLGNALQILVVKAVVHRAAGNPDEALSALARAFELGEPEGYLRVFLDEGEPMARLLRRFALRAPASAYIQQLLDALGISLDMPSANPAPLAEALTARELEIIKLIADGATNLEIARELVLTVNTVKKHTSNIFAKLDAGNRSQAVAHARNLNLL